MIHVHANSKEDGAEPKLQFTLLGMQDIKKFQILLNRALNCVPEFGEDWFELAARVDDFIERNKS